jgi:plastocyanin
MTHRSSGERVGNARMQPIWSRWLDIVSALALCVLLAACGGSQGAPTATPAPAGAAAPAGGAGGGAATVTVVAKDFRFSLDRTEVPAGTTTFVLKNAGPSPHDFRITGNGVDRQTATINQGATASLTVDLAPGTYAIGCTVPGHDLLGMKGTVTVH